VLRLVQQAQFDLDVIAVAVDIIRRAAA